VAGLASLPHNILIVVLAVSSRCGSAQTVIYC